MLVIIQFNSIEDELQCRLERHQLVRDHNACMLLEMLGNFRQVSLTDSLTLTFGSSNVTHQTSQTVILNDELVFSRVTTSQVGGLAAVSFVITTLPPMLSI